MKKPPSIDHLVRIPPPAALHLPQHRPAIDRKLTGQACGPRLLRAGRAHGERTVGIPCAPRFLRTATRPVRVSQQTGETGGQDVPEPLHDLIAQLSLSRRGQPQVIDGRAREFGDAARGQILTPNAQDHVRERVPVPEGDQVVAGQSAPVRVCPDQHHHTFTHERREPGHFVQPVHNGHGRGHTAQRSAHLLSEQRIADGHADAGRTRIVPHARLTSTVALSCPPPPHAASLSAPNRARTNWCPTCLPPTASRPELACGSLGCAGSKMWVRARRASHRVVTSLTDLDGESRCV